MGERKAVLQTLLFILLAVVIAVTGCSSNSKSGDQNSSSLNQGNQGDGRQSQASPKKGGEITIAYGVDVSNFDPIKGSNGADHALLWPVYETLIKFTPDLQLVPGLAESWEFENDVTLILHLRKGVTFHDGTPFNAEAVKFNIERTNSEGSLVSDLKAVKNVEVINEYAVKLHLSKPDASILAALTDRGGMMVSPTAVKRYGDGFPQHPTGAGPFKVAEHVPGKEIVYERYADYWNADEVYLDKFTISIIADENSRINALKSGKVQFVPGIQPQNIGTLEAQSDIELIKGTSLQFAKMYINTNMEPFTNKAVRLAVTHGINRDQLVKSLNFGYGEAAYQPFPKGYWAHDPNVVIEYNPKKAKQLLRDAGLNNVTFQLLRAPDPYNARLADLIKAQLQEVGITVDVEAMEPNAAVSAFFNKQSTALLGNWTGRVDPQLTINSLYSKDSFYNIGKVSTPNIDRLIQEAAVTYDQRKRAGLYSQIMKEVLLDEGFDIPLFFPPVIGAYHKSVKGIENNMLGKPLFYKLWVEK
ncbi:ABC transporter substrate-binding protein [Geobacillus zalihae]|uniref:ABC transporter substrate-binding protein n=1 Tax=Geobacillus zalihae TaxID=213419 RepID=UPI0016804C1E|nr:ABC transporter substrate-binding protein [Geobacillus zalihae]QNU25925.1 ABC transporter substrate-binding protein [Geobacillus zalihae]